MPSCSYVSLAKGLHKTVFTLSVFQMHIPEQYKTVWMLYGLRNTSMISCTGPYGACNGPIEPNRPGGPLTGLYGIRMTIQGPSTGQNRTMTMS